MGLQITRKPCDGKNTIVLDVKAPCTIEVRLTHIDRNIAGIKIDAPKDIVSIARKESLNY